MSKRAKNISRRNREKEERGLEYQMEILSVEIEDFEADHRHTERMTDIMLNLQEQYKDLTGHYYKLSEINR